VLRDTAVPALGFRFFCGAPAALIGEKRMTSRRDFMGVAVATAAVGAPLEAVAQQATRTMGAVKAISGQSIAALRAELSAAVGEEDTQLREWLGRFSPALDTRGVAAVRKAGDVWLEQAARQRFLYDPLLSEAHLRSAAALLDQALAYRNE
jgi:hypothetical protein